MRDFHKILELDTKPEMVAYTLGYGDALQEVLEDLRTVMGDVRTPGTDTLTRMTLASLKVAEKTLEVLKR